MRRARSPILLQSQIEAAMKITRSNRAAAIYLRVSYKFYKKFASLYKNSEGISLFELHRNKEGKGIPKVQKNSQKGKKLDDILLNKYKSVPKDRLLRRLFTNGYLKECCGSCGYSIKRPTDLKTPLTLNFKNGNREDYRLDNLEALCYNCYFVQIGDLRIKDLRASINVLPEVKSSEEIMATNTDPDALGVLSDEEKMSILKELQNL